MENAGRPRHEGGGGGGARHGRRLSPPVEPASPPRGGDAAQLVLARGEHRHAASQLSSAERVAVQPGCGVETDVGMVVGFWLLVFGCWLWMRYISEWLSGSHLGEMAGLSPGVR